jgi:FtsP/CotA-like multicopper oxidase with cupredoxin domain
MGKSPKAPGSLFSRRGLMRAGFGVGTALLLPNLPGSIPFGRASPAHDHEPADDDRGSKNFKPGAAFVEPEVRSSANGELNTTLRMQYAYKNIGGYRLYVRTYEGAVPGPTLRLKPGDVLHIKLINDMPPNRDPEPIKSG